MASCLQSQNAKPNRGVPSPYLQLCDLVCNIATCSSPRPCPAAAAAALLCQNSLQLLLHRLQPRLRRTARRPLPTQLLLGVLQLAQRVGGRLKASSTRSGDLHIHIALILK